LFSKFSKLKAGERVKIVSYSMDILRNTNSGWKEGKREIERS